MCLQIRRSRFRDQNCVAHAPEVQLLSGHREVRSFAWCGHLMVVVTVSLPARFPAQVPLDIFSDLPGDVDGGAAWPADNDAKT